MKEAPVLRKPTIQPEEEPTTPPRVPEIKPNPEKPTVDPEETPSTPVPIPPEKPDPGPPEVPVNPDLE